MSDIIEQAKAILTADTAEVAQARYNSEWSDAYWDRVTRQNEAMLAILDAWIDPELGSTAGRVATHEAALALARAIVGGDT